MHPLGTGFDALLTRGALGVLVIAAGWSVIVVASVAIEARTQGRVQLSARTGCPPALRLWLLGLFVMFFAGVAPAQASGTGSGSGAPDAAITAALDGLPLPDRVVGGPQSATNRSTTDIVVVRAGDSLWRIASRLLPVHSDPATVARTTAALYDANRRTIGPDPDLLSPGQHLVVPNPEHQRRNS